MLSYTLNQTAKILGVTRQAIHVQQKNGKLPMFVEEGRKRITIDEIAKFKAQKYTRDKHFRDGFISTKKAAEECGTELNRIYYLIYNHVLPAKRKNGMWFIHVDDLEKCNIFTRVRRASTSDRKIPDPIKNFKRIKRI